LALLVDGDWNPDAQGTDITLPKNDFQYKRIVIIPFLKLLQVLPSCILCFFRPVEGADEIRFSPGALKNIPAVSPSGGNRGFGPVAVVHSFREVIFTS
jgi:hypothetical protein